MSARFTKLDTTSDGRRNAANGAVVGFLLAVTALVITGVVTLGATDGRSETVGGVPIPSGAQCVRASRHANYVSVWLPVGTPLRSTEILLRLDRVADGDVGLVLSGPSVAQSTTLKCDLVGNCADAMLLQLDGPKSGLSRVIGNFSYTSAVQNYDLATYFLHLSGELSLVAGFDYFLTTTHLCWAESSSGDPAVGSVEVNTSGALTATGLSPPSCSTASAELFPPWAALELRWLALTTRYLYEHAPTVLDERREAVECVEDHMTSPYFLDCTPTGCRTVPSVTYRRIAASAKLLLQISPDGDSRLLIEKTSTLSRIPDLMSPSRANFIAFLRLLLLLLAAAVTFIRSSQVASSSREIMLRAVRTSRRKPRGCVENHTRVEVSIDALIGLASVAARAATVGALSSALLSDGQDRLVAAEFTGCAASLVHLVLRHLLEVDRKYETPLVVLGGTQSVIDVACACLLIFSETPFLATRHSFAATGRMLAALMVVTTSLNTAVFATTANALLLATVTSQESSVYRLMLVGGLVCWTFQLISVVITFCTAFVLPFVFQVAREQAGGHTTRAYTVFFGSVATGLPTLNRIMLGVVARVKHDKLK